MDLLIIHNSPETIAAKTAAIHQAILRDSRCIRQPNFERIATEDVARLFELYDREFLGGWLAPAVLAKTGVPLKFRLSSTMTNAGGKTITYRRRGIGGESHSYEIAIASRMLFMTFREVEREITVCGLPCTDRLQALQRIMEHEIIHLSELVMWDESSCSQIRFKKLARNIFGHTDTTHALVTPREHAAVRHDLRVGAMVEFDFEGRRRVGRVNRIHQRATVLVEDPAGRLYTDGKEYLKFYMPLESLRPLGTPIS